MTIGSTPSHARGDWVASLTGGVLPGAALASSNALAMGLEWGRCAALVGGCFSALAASGEEEAEVAVPVEPAVGVIEGTQGG